MKAKQLHKTSDSTAFAPYPVCKMQPNNSNLTSTAYYLQYGGQQAKKSEEQAKEICK